MANRPGRKRISIDIPEKLHQNLFIVAESRNVTLTKYVIRALIRYSLHETKYDENNELFEDFK